MKGGLGFAGLVLLGCGSSSIPALEQEEDLRVDDSSRLRGALSSPDPGVRRRAGVAVGRLQSRRLIPPLIDSLRSETSPQVLTEFLFAAGQIAYGEDWKGDDTLAAEASRQADHPDGTVRAAAIEALGKMGGAVALETATRALGDASAEVRGQAALALFRYRWGPARRDPAKEAPTWPRETLAALLVLADDPEAGVRWRVAYSMARIPEPRAVDTLARLARDPQLWSRVFAVRALGRTKAAAAKAPVAAALGDPEYLVRVEAVNAAAALGALENLPMRLQSDPSFHVRTALAQALGHEAAPAGVERLLADPSPSVRAAAIQSHSRRSPSASAPSIRKTMADPSWVVRAAAARASASLGEDGLEFIEAALRDQDERVRSSAIEAISDIPCPRALSVVTAALGSGDLSVRGSAVDAIAKFKDADPFPLLTAAYEHSRERSFTEVRESIVDQWVRNTDARATDALRRALHDPAPSVRTKAARALERRGVAVGEVGGSSGERSPFLGSTFSRNPVVVLETDRGALEIELLSAEAPIHSANFVKLARERFYDGLIWHRVVSNFVIQGGDPRGDGWGDAGYSVRDEINRVRYDRGTVGMPKSGKDTGGCQIFITHTPAPHLDGAYTAFGRVIQGMEVVDRIEPGDRILRATVRR